MEYVTIIVSSILAACIVILFIYFMFPKTIDFALDLEGIAKGT